jgi:histidine triad (HIT) family protein
VADDCLFCKIASGELATPRLREDDETLIFPDINPQAPVHVLVITKRHFRDLTELVGDPAASAAVLAAIRAYVTDAAIVGYRTVFNTGVDGGQTVPHVHAHLLAGRKMTWPPG